MKKPDSLRDWIQRGFSQTKFEGDQLQIFVDNGALAGRAAKGPVGFEYRYTLNVILQDFAGDPNALFVLLVIWLRRHQRELLENADKMGAVRFEVDRLAEGKVDVSIEIPLTEAVTTRPRAGGGPTDFDLVVIDEPIDADVVDAFGRNEAGAVVPLLHRIYFDGELLVSCSAHPGPP